MTLVKKLTLWAMVVILLIAAVLRLWALSELPVGLHYDEAANVILTRQIVRGDARPLFIRAYTGKEVLFFYLAAPWVWMTGGAPWGLRLGAAMLGVLTVAATFAAVRAMWGGTGVSLAAAGWVAVAFPHVLLSRYGFRAISQPLLQALTVALLWRGLKSGRLRWLIGGGIALGLTGYTYLAARLFPVPLGVALVWGWLRQPTHRRARLGRNLAIAIAAAALTFAPLAWFFLQNPEAFITRIDQVAAPTWRDAAQGILRCLVTLGVPGRGDPYVRFNQPGLPVMDGLSVVLSGLGLWVLLRRQRESVLQNAATLLTLLGAFVMLLPSALATTEITPSNLRMVGLFPLIAALPAWGLEALLQRVANWLRVRGIRGGFPHHELLSTLIPLILLLGLVAIGALRTGTIYARWARSTALFYEADGEMVLAARTLDALSGDPGAEDAVTYIASEHYRHPTVAALAEAYPQAKWITGGATRVVPAEGSGITMVPATLTAPGSWPRALTEAWTVETRADPAGAPALRIYRLEAAAATSLRGDDPADTDFAHVVRVHDVQPCEDGQAGEPCAVRVIWEPQAAYTALQPVVRLLHPETGEWDRAMPFHYPAEMWAPGEGVVDYLTVTPPVGMPPGNGYQIALGFYDPGQQVALPRLDGEQFAGLEMRVPAGSFAPAVPGRWREACPGVPERPVAVTGGLQLDGWQLAVPGSVPQGAQLPLTLCWRAQGESPSADEVKLRIQGTTEEHLYTGPPAGGYTFAQWREGERVEDRYRLSLPKTLPGGSYTLTLAVDDRRVTSLGSIAVTPITRSFAAPAPGHPVGVRFGEALQLVGYDRGPFRPGEPWPLTLYWRVRRELDRDYRVFVHLRNPTTGVVVAQTDATPGEGGYPTNLWMEGEIITDTHRLSLPEDLPAEIYTVDIGLYVPMTGDYLDVDGERSLRLIERIEAEPPSIKAEP
jgi:4-amino-4-deoxy-L-arabinose transferase-like glycosyltransferase